MSTSLSSLVGNLFEISNKKCKDKNCESKCDFIGIKNNKLQDKCKDYQKRLLKPTD